MAKLSTKARRGLPGKVFAGPGRSYPIPDKGHARAAIVDASRSEKLGHISKALESRIDAKAKAKLAG